MGSTAVTAAVEAEEQRFQNGDAHIAQDAIPAAGGLGLALQGLCAEHDPGALISVAGDAVLAGIGNEPGANAHASRRSAAWGRKFCAMRSGCPLFERR